MNKRIMLLKHKFSINLTIRQQILVAMLAVALFATAIIGIAIYSISKSTIEKNYSNLRSNNLQISSRIVELQTEPIIEIGRSLLVDKVFRKIMQEETSSTPYFSGTNQLTLDKTLSSLMALDENIAGTDALYDLPLGMNVEGFWYNKAAFEQADVEVPTTWEEFEDVCAKLNDAGVQPLTAGGADKWPVTRLVNAYVMRSM
ncbi:MAG: extracellular solute-binding protein, partial [Eubacteriales bacterium]|nr:extracellular solute-binding protein [Eubacteriales bacterium]